MLLVIIVFFQVLNRFILHIPAAWTEEIGRFIFVWASAVGIALALRKKAHIGLSIIVNSLPKSLRKIVELISKIIMLAFYIIVLYWGSIWSYYGLMESTNSLQWVPMFYIYVAIPFSALLLTIFSIDDLYEFFIDIVK
ncbi:MAG: TRAP transporter small permease [Promethearchaeota archaeon]